MFFERTIGNLRRNNYKLWKEKPIVPKNNSCLFKEQQILLCCLSCKLVVFMHCAGKPLVNTGSNLGKMAHSSLVWLHPPPLNFHILTFLNWLSLNQQCIMFLQEPLHILIQYTSHTKTDCIVSIMQHTYQIQWSERPLHAIFQSSASEVICWLITSGLI